VEYARQMEAARHAAEEARAIAEAANAAKSDFLANVSHELRTPLASIFGFTRIVQKRLEERLAPQLGDADPKLQRTVSQVEENLEIILDESQRLMTMINDLLDLEKIEAGRMEWALRPMGVGEVVRQAASATSSLFEGKDLRFVVDVQADLPWVNGDPDRIKQVAINLISNAVKFAPSGVITVRAYQQDQEIIVDVIDEGIGIDPKDYELVFEKFRQLGDTLTSKPKGTGLGLAISKEIITRHEGRIWFTSTPGQGSAFSFALPVWRPGSETNGDAGQGRTEPGKETDVQPVGG
jgi:signal transduction histidine kinase